MFKICTVSFGRFVLLFDGEERFWCDFESLPVVFINGEVVVYASVAAAAGVPTGGIPAGMFSTETEGMGEGVAVVEVLEIEVNTLPAVVIGSCTLGLFPIAGVVITELAKVDKLSLERARSGSILSEGYLHVIGCCWYEIDGEDVEECLTTWFGWGCTSSNEWFCW